MSGMTKELMRMDARQQVQRAAWLIRSRPVPGADEWETQAWQQSAGEFLDSPTIQIALGQLGVTPVEGAPNPVEDLAAFLPGLDQALDAHDDNPVAATVVTVVAAMVAGLLAGQQARTSRGR
jgi:hypothetical protein